jgi:2',3'-cyclic-nucleotide 2'-phosphodiesterase (5'-nucleotidase family)
MSALRRLLIVLCLAILLPAAAWAETAKITFILTNDIYSMGATAMPDGRQRGGFARLAAVIKAERTKARSEGSHVVFAHGGDTLSPSLMSGIDRGAHIIALTNMIPPDIFAPGNHEFDFGKAEFLKRMAEAKFPIYAANLRGPDGQPLPGIKDRSIVEFGGIRIGLTGAAYEDTPKVSSSEDLKFLPTVPTVRQQTAALRQEGADFVVAVLHADRTQAQELAAGHAADVILTGHNHDLLVSYDGRVAMAESSYDAHYVTLIDVSIEVSLVEGRREVKWWPQFRIIDTATVTPDPEVAAVVAKLEAELSRELDVPLASVGVELDSRNIAVRTGEAAIGNLIADAMRSKTGADAAVTNGGGIRGGKVYPAGSAITRRDVLAELPFNNRLVTIEIRGRDLRTALENGFSRLSDAAGRFPQVSGLRIEFDPRRPPGQRILSVKVGGVLLSPNRVYRIATNDFLARGSDGYVSFGKAKPLLPADDSPLLANEVMDHVRKLGTVRTGVEGRIDAVRK